MQTCGICHTQSTDDTLKCGRCGADLKVSSQNALVLARMQANARVSQIRVSVMDTGCPACAAVQGAYAKDQAPTLPTVGCSHPLGCRCHYEPVLNEIYP